MNSEKLKSVLSYDEQTGVFTWLSGTRNYCRGDVAGGPTDRGYWRISLANERHTAHRLAWLYVHGEWPNSQIDHINGNRTDNRICNLRLSDNSSNHANSKRYSTNLSGYKGVSWSKDKGKWFSRVMKNYKSKHLGYFDTPADAHAAYVAAAKTIHGHFARAA